ncbi:MAG: allophanate hydrolase [Planctomycetota bacterium]|nr:allophanate hydrolase [Planctomycetota bacterium]MCX8040004.1 allophanate hydrolase [Planctomycetota bacterium]MDW8372906.1 allophanate hydrolase [Planctomycetota bacterium]
MNDAIFIHRVEPPPGDGPLLAVKDNIDVAGMPTTAGCPSFAYLPERDAACVARLRAWGARIIGKTNLDQFATGLVGTRSPYGTPRNPFDARRVPGGSSSGSAVAVATGSCRLALGTDTAGSGRVPAAFCNIIGFKPTRGWISTQGVVPACRSLDCVSVFALTVSEAWEAVQVMAGYDPEDPWSRSPPCVALPSGRCTIGIPEDPWLAECDPDWRAGWRRALGMLRDAGHRITTIDFAPFAEAAAMLYGGAWVAERTAAVGEHIARGGPDLDPTVARIIAGGRGIDAVQAMRDAYRLAELRRLAEAAWARCDALCLPTAPCHPTLAEVAADPIGVNARLGRFTNFANLLDTCAVAAPAGFTQDGLPVGVTLYAPAWHDLLVARLAAGLQDALGLTLGATGRRAPAPQRLSGDDGLIEIAVFGLHMRGQPGERQMLALGARCQGRIVTAARYRLFVLPGEPRRPGLWPALEGGRAIAGELWRLPRHRLGELLALVPPSLGLGSIALADGRSVRGFLLTDPAALAGATDISDAGSWPAWLAARTAS